MSVSGKKSKFRRLIRKRSNRSLWWLLLFSFVWTLVFQLTTFLFFQSPDSVLFPSVKAIFSAADPVSVLNDSELSLALEFLLDKGIVWDFETFLDSIYSFYEAVITILVCALGLVAAFAYLSIRGESLERVESLSAEKVKEMFTSREFSQEVREHVNRRIEDENMDVGSVYDKISQLEEELESLRKVVKSLDMDSDDGSELDLR